MSVNKFKSLMESYIKTYPLVFNLAKGFTNIFLYPSSVVQKLESDVC